MNSTLQAKLDMIYAIIAPDFEEEVPVEEDGQSFVQIEGLGPNKKKPTN